MPFLAPLIGAIGTALGAVGSFISGLSVVGKIIIGIGLNVAATLIQRSMQKDQPKNEQPEPPGGVRLERRFGGQEAREVAVGLVGIAGHDAYVNTFGGKANDLWQQVFFLSDYYSTRLTRLAINGRWVTVDFENPHASRGFPITSAPWAGQIWVKFLDGRQTTADDWLKDWANPSNRWSENHIGVGMTMAIITMDYDEEKLNSPPDFFFEFEGAPLYDWRKDSTNGGSGTHRWANKATHEFSKNPIVAAYNYRRGFSINDDLFCGMEMDVADLPIDKWTLAANVCDEDNAQGLPRYEVSIFLNCMATHGDNLESLMFSCGGLSIDDVEGSWPIVGTDQPIVATIEDEDLVPEERPTFTRYRSMSDIVNSIGGNYAEPALIWSSDSYATQISATGLVLDRRTRDLDMNFMQVSRRFQAAQLAGIYLKENRLEASGQLTLKPRWQWLKSGDWIVINAAPFGGLTYMVTQSSLSSLSEIGPRNNTISVQQRAGGIYDPVDPDEEDTRTPPGAPNYLNEVENFSLLAVKIDGDDGDENIAIRASWDPILDRTITGVRLRYWPTAQPTVINTKIVPVDQSTVFLSEGVVASTEYTVKPKLISSPARPLAEAAGDTVTTLAKTNDELDVVLTEADEAFKLLLKRLAEENVQLRDYVRQLAVAVASGAGKAIENFAAVSKSGEALAASFLNLEAYAGEDGVLATALLGVQGEFDTLTASGRIRFVAEIPPPDGILAMINIFARVDDSEDSTFVQTGMSIQVYMDGLTLRSRIILTTDRLIVKSGVNEAQPFVFSDGVLYGQALRVRSAMIDELAVKNAHIETLHGTKILDGTMPGAKITGGSLLNSHFQNGTINGARIVGGTIRDTEIEESAITNSADDKAAGTGLTESWVTKLSATISSPTNKPLKIDYGGLVTFEIQSNPSNYPVEAGIRLLVDGVEKKVNFARATQDEGSNTLDVNKSTQVKVTGRGSHLVQVQYRIRSSDVAFLTAPEWDGELFIQCNKR